MVTIQARNVQSGLVEARARYIQALIPEQERYELPGPLCLSLERPEERVMAMPGVGQNPAQELADALVSIVQAAPVIIQVGEAMRKGPTPGFQLATPTLVVRLQPSEEGLLSVVGITTESDLFQAAFGQMLLQLSMLHELIARAAGLEMGSLTFIQTEVAISRKGRDAIGPHSFEAAWHDGYTMQHCSPYPFDESLEPLLADLKMFVTEQDQAVGYKSRFVRHVAIPLLQAAKLAEKDPQAARKALERIAADDWRYAMERMLG